MKIDSGEIPLFISDDADAPKADAPFVERNAVTAVVYNPRTQKYLGLKWKEVDWDTVITGGIEEGQTPEEAARAEISEETGYEHLSLIAELPRYDAKFYHHPKGVNRYAHFWCFLFELTSDERRSVDGDELAKHECVWLSPEEMETFRLPEGQRFVFNNVTTVLKNSNETTI